MTEQIIYEKPVLMFIAPQEGIIDDNSSILMSEDDFKLLFRALSQYEPEESEGQSYDWLLEILDKELYIMGIARDY